MEELTQQQISQKIWIMNNMDKIRANNKRYRENHPDRVRETYRKWWAKNKDKLAEKNREKSRQYYQEHKEEIFIKNKEYRKEYYEKNREEILRKNKERYWQKKAAMEIKSEKRN